MPTIVDGRGRRVSLSRAGEIAIIDSEGRERATFRIPYGATLQFESGHIVSKGERMRSEEHTSELQSLMRISYAVFCLKKKTTHIRTTTTPTNNTNKNHQNIPPHR